MDRNEILKKAQNKNNAPDEMELQITQKASSMAVFAILVFSLILMITKILTDQPWHDVYSFMFVSMGITHLYKGIKLKQKHEIVLGVLFSLSALLCLVSAIYEYATM